MLIVTVTKQWNKFQKYTFSCSTTAFRGRIFAEVIIYCCSICS
jgi:hypothetical protein